MDLFVSDRSLHGAVWCRSQCILCSVRFPSIDYNRSLNETNRFNGASGIPVVPSSPPRRRTRLFRRTYLATLGTGLFAGLAGCLDGIGGSDGIDSEELDTSGGDDGGGMPDRWSQHTKLTPADDSVSQFGSSVALAGDGTTALVSATRHEDADGLKPGPAFVLERTDSGWRLLAELAPDSDDSEMGFGENGGSTALSDDGTTAIVGADKADEPHGPRAGSAYVFERGDGTWGQQSKLVADDGGKQDFFGSSVALSGDGRTAFVGAWNNENPAGAEAGSAYVFERTDGGWSQQTTLTPDRTTSAGRFGWSVALEDDTAVIGDPADDQSNGERAGSASVFQRTGGTWSQQATLVPDDGDTGDFFGGSVAIRGDTAVIGAPEDDDPNGERAGSAYVFERADGAWSQRVKLVPDDGDPIDLFGVAVALSGDTALIGARVDEDPNGDAAGSAYVFERADGAWRQQVKLTAADGQSHDIFGRSVALQGDTAVIGTTRGGAYVF